MECVRIWFSKTGRVKYISHLDTMRCFTRAVRRAGIPLWYTEGFNPRPYLNFLLPLPLGVEGIREPLDIKLDNQISFEEIKNRLNSVMPEGIEIKVVSQPFSDKKDIAFGNYEITLQNESGLAEKLREAIDSGALKCEKIGKQSGRKTVKTVDISGNIKSAEVKEENDIVLINAVLPCGNEINISPINLMTSINSYLNSDIAPINMRRTNIIDCYMKDFE